MNNPHVSGSDLDASNVCIVIPCYNEEKRLDVATFRAFLSPDQGPRILFVDDGSRDRTRTVLESLCCENALRAGILVCETNRGKAEAVRKGILYALDRYRPSLIGYWDADLATPLSSIASFVRILEDSQFEMVFGARVDLLGRHIERRAVRHYLGRIFATVVSISLGVAIYDSQCGAKLFRADSTSQQIFTEPFLSRWVFDVEILARYMKAYGGDRKRLEDSIYEYPLERWVDVAGSKVRPKDFFHAFWDVLKIKAHYR